MNRAGHRLVTHQLDHPLDFAPSAEVDEIAKVTASAGAQGGFRSGIFAETLDELSRFGEGGGREGCLLEQCLPRFGFERL
jgi:hypothetical protein